MSLKGPLFLILCLTDATPLRTDERRHRELSDDTHLASIGEEIVDGGVPIRHGFDGIAVVFPVSAASIAQRREIIRASQLKLRACQS